MKLFGASACLKDGVLAIKKELRSTTVTIDDKVYNLTNKRPSEFNEGVWIYTCKEQ